MGGDSCMVSRDVFHSSWRWSGMARVAGDGRGPVHGRAGVGTVYMHAGKPCTSASQHIGIITSYSYTYGCQVNTM